ncbi:hypothetical protein M422DRAFT_252570 [Sphaerobolus stellatus SS14]|uniref:Thioredoxin domain-containing protein n=1 Tax=Sphaerobolus stellatus (strain SS14) TaxID=990650 RepID=A0A0C9ULY7_SPHS4|nr:hypothetical protein M422DRAFT_252570 [Sphaerobolus stellatus SS14]
MLLLSLLPLFALSAFAAKNSASADPRDQLIALAAEGNGVIKLDDDTYNLLTSPSRNWSAIVQLTALNSFKCGPCKELDPAFRTLGRAWTKVPTANRNDHFFASLDFEDGKHTFNKLGLSSAPAIRVFPAAKGPRKPHSGNTDPISSSPLSTAVSTPPS